VTTPRWRRHVEIATRDWRRSARGAPDKPGDDGAADQYPDRCHWRPVPDRPLEQVVDDESSDPTECGGEADEKDASDDHAADVRDWCRRLPSYRDEQESNYRSECEALVFVVAPCLRSSLSNM